MRMRLEFFPITCIFSLHEQVELQGEVVDLVSSAQSRVLVSASIFLRVVDVVII